MGSKHVVSSHNVVLTSSKSIWVHHWKHSIGIYYSHSAPHTFNEWLAFHEWMNHVIIFDRWYVDWNLKKKNKNNEISSIRLNKFVNVIFLYAHFWRISSIDLNASSSWRSNDEIPKAHFSCIFFYGFVHNNVENALKRIARFWKWVPGLNFLISSFCLIIP